MSCWLAFSPKSSAMPVPSALAMASSVAREGAFSPFSMRERWPLCTPTLTAKTSNVRPFFRLRLRILLETDMHLVSPVLRDRQQYRLIDNKLTKGVLSVHDVCRSQVPGEEDAGVFRAECADRNG